MTSLYEVARVEPYFLLGFIVGMIGLFLLLRIMIEGDQP